MGKNNKMTNDTVILQINVKWLSKFPHFSDSNKISTHCHKTVITTLHSAINF